MGFEAYSFGLVQTANGFQDFCIVTLLNALFGIQVRNVYKLQIVDCLDQFSATFTTYLLPFSFG